MASGRYLDGAMADYYSIATAQLTIPCSEADFQEPGTLITEEVLDEGGERRIGRHYSRPMPGCTQKAQVGASAAIAERPEGVCNC